MTSDASGRLLSLLSHELRSPLGVIRGYLRILDSPPVALTDQQRQAVTAALRAADHAVHLVDQASFLAQLRRGEAQLHPTRVDVRALLESAIQSVSPQGPKSTCVLGDVAIESISANRDQLRDALSSFIGAVARAQATPATITVTAHRQNHEDKEGLILRFERPGKTGVPIETALDTTRGGLGLDLPIAEAIIASHDGRVTELLDDGRCVGVLVWVPVAS